MEITDRQARKAAIVLEIRQRSWSGKAGKVKNGWVTSGRERNRRNGEQWTGNPHIGNKGTG